MTPRYRYLLRAPPTSTGEPLYDRQGFQSLVDVAERLAELKWKWTTAFDHGNQPPSQPGEHRDNRLAELLHLPWVPSGDPSRPPSTHLQEGLYVAEWLGPGDTDFGEPRPWFSVPGLERLVAERLPPVASTNLRAPDPTPESVLIWSEADVRAAIRAMLTRPLVLLAGISGSGKTQLARLIGRAWAHGAFGRDDDEQSALNKLTGGVLTRSSDGWLVSGGKPGTASDERFGFIAVQSDWTEASHLWGYHVPLPAEAEGFYGTEALRVFLSAQRNPDKQHCLLLDEMNLSRPEHYASDLLSAMEVQGSPVIRLHRAGHSVRLRDGSLQASSQASAVPARIAWPKGLVVIGTVNVDETTFSFAPKVLDRAALLELTDIDLTVFESHKDFQEHRWWFNEVQRICRPHNLHLGYRAVREVLDTLAKASPLAQKKVVLDLQLCNKVLPRIRGPRAVVEPLLGALLPLAKCAGTENTTLLKEHYPPQNLRKEYARVPDPQHLKQMSHSERKIAEMLRRAYSVGFTSFFA